MFSYYAAFNLTQHTHTHTHTQTHTHTPKGWILSAFYYGYIVTQIPGGWLAERIGGKWVFGVGVVTSSSLALFIPLAAFTNVWLLVAVRMVAGFFEVRGREREGESGVERGWSVCSSILLCKIIIVFLENHKLFFPLLYI